MPSISKALLLIFLIFTQNIDCFEYSDACGNKNCGDYIDEEKDPQYADYLKTGLKTAAVAGTAIAAAPLVISAAGFGSAGVVGGSVASAVQATWFGGYVSGVTGVIFSGLQSIGAAGLGTAGKITIGSASSAAFNVYDTYFGKSTSDDKKKKKHK